VGFVAGSLIAWSDGLKPLHSLTFGDTKLTLYTGLLALAVNIVVAVVVNAVLTLGGRNPAVAAGR